MTDMFADEYGIDAGSGTPPSHRTAPADPVTVFGGGLPLRLAEGRPLPFTSRPSTPLELRLKRLFDISVGTAALIVLGPLLLLVALAIRLTSKGPALFRQKRVGLNGALFELYKFRTMAIEDCDASGVRQTVAGDSRVTPLGRFLRATSIDELPQLWNIVLGDMSVVGPRPMVLGQLAAGRDYRELVPYYDYRSGMKPGLTGWAQCHGLRGPTREAGPAIARVNFDCAYIQNFSFWLDLVIIWKTAKREFFGGTGF